LFNSGGKKPLPYLVPYLYESICFLQNSPLHFFFQVWDEGICVQVKKYLRSITFFPSGIRFGSLPPQGDGGKRLGKTQNFLRANLPGKKPLKGQALSPKIHIFGFGEKLFFML